MKTRIQFHYYRIIFSGIWILLPLVLSAQKPGIWYFGQKAGISFTGGTSVVSVSSNPISTPEGCAVLEGPPGAVNFYSNGEVLLHNGVLEKGFHGSMYSCQSALFFVPNKVKDTIYLFTTDDYNGTHGLCYNIIQSGNNNTYKITKNLSLLPSATERMTLVSHCNKKSKWLITHQWNTDAFYAWRLDEDGTINPPVISHCGTVHSGNKLNAKGCIKASIDGSKLALAKMSDGTVEVFHFDDVTGIVDDPILISGLPNAYGVEFASGGNVLYVSTVSGTLAQFSLSVWNATQINNSRYNIGTQAQLFGSLQLGPDNMIYVARDNSYYLARIELPNSMGASCIYNPTAVYLGGRKSEAGLPQMSFGGGINDFKGSIVCLGDTTFFEILGDTTRIDSVLWYFGENPVLDSSKSFRPYYIFNSLGKYHVHLVLYHCDTTDTLDNWAQIVGPPGAYLGPDTFLCSNEPLILNPGKATGYLWDNGSTKSNRVINDTGTYWVRLSNSCGEAYDTIRVTDVFDPPVILLPPDTAICGGDSLILDAGFDSSMCMWQGNFPGRYYTAKVAGYYTLEVTDTTGCHSTEGFQLEVDSMPFIDLGPDTTICIGHDLTFNGHSHGHYLWQDGSTDSSYTVQQSGTYYVSIRNACGESRDSCDVIFEDCKQVIWVPNAFTPNGDGTNDVFLPWVENVTDYHLYIFNRWGELIFETHDPYKGWDGSYKGGEALEGVYNWRIDYINYSGKSFNQYGYVILYR